MRDHTGNHPCSMETFAKARQYTEAAISLNNMGVSLFERFCYKEALEAFENGIRVVCSCQFERNRWEKVEPIPRYLQDLSKGTPALSLAEAEHKVYRTSLHLSCDDSEPEDLPPLLPLSIDQDENSSSEDKDCLSEGMVHICNQYGESMDISSPSTREQREGPRLVYYQQSSSLLFRKNADTTAPRNLLASLLHNRGQVYRYKIALAKYSSSPHTREQDLDKAVESFFLAREVSLKPSTAAATAAYEISS